MMARIEGLHRKLTKLGAAEARRPGPGPTYAARAISSLSEFNSSNLPQLKAELDCLDLRAKGVARLPADVGRSLAKLREQVEWLEHLLPPA
jgi:hypothetical protein